MPYLCVITGAWVGIVAVVGLLAGMKRQRNLLRAYATGLLVVVLLNSATSYFSTELRLDILKWRQGDKAEKDSALTSLKRYNHVHFMLEKDNQ